MNRKDTLHWLAQGIVNITEGKHNVFEHGSRTHRAMASALQMLSEPIEIAERFYVAIGAMHWGKALTAERAITALKRTGYKLRDGYIVQRLPENAHSVVIGAMGDISWKGTNDGIVDLPVVEQRNGPKFKRTAPVCGTAYNDACGCELCESYCNKADHD